MKLISNISPYLLSILLSLNLVPYLPLAAQSIDLTGSSSNPGQMAFRYKVRKSESLFNLTKTFQCLPSDLYLYNSQTPVTKLLEGDVISIYYRPNLLREDSLPSSLPVYYTVQPKDNLFALINRKLKLSKTHLLRFNPTLKNGLISGTALKLGFIHFVSPYKEKGEPPLNISSANDPQAIEEAENNYTKSGRGLVFVERGNLGIGRYFVLHATAKMDSWMEIENPVNGRKLFAKVIGRIPPIYPAGVQLVVSTSVAAQLGVPDDRFYAIFAFD